MLWVPKARPTAIAVPLVYIVPLLVSWNKINKYCDICCTDWRIDFFDKCWCPDVSWNGGYCRCEWTCHHNVRVACKWLHESTDNFENWSIVALFIRLIKLFKKSCNEAQHMQRYRLVHDDNYRAACIQIQPQWTVVVTLICPHIQTSRHIYRETFRSDGRKLTWQAYKHTHSI